MRQLSTETRAKVVLQKTKGVHVQQIVKHPEYAGYVFSHVVHGRDLPLEKVSMEPSVHEYIVSSFLIRFLPSSNSTTCQSHWWCINWLYPLNSNHKPRLCCNYYTCASARTVLEGHSCACMREQCTSVTSKRISIRAQVTRELLGSKC